MRSETEKAAREPAERRSTDESQGIGIVLVDPLPTVRAGLQMLIDSQPDMDVLAQASTADEGIGAVRGLGQRTSVVILLGIGLTGEHDSFWLIRALRERFPTLFIVACGANSEKTVISRAFFMGVDGFVDKNAEPAEFLDALRRSAEGEVVLVGPPPAWLGSISEDIDRQHNASPLLTAREQEVMVLAAEGLTARAIGTRLGLAERTITTHLHRIYSKLEVNTRVAAIQAAAREGLLSLIPAP
ncbi:MAG: response regulator transcription factor [Actinomycetota bacterium]